MEVLRDIPHDLTRSRTATSYADDIIIIVPDEGQLPCVENAIERYETVAGETNQDNPISLQLGTWREKSMPSNNFVGVWAEGTFKMIGLWFWFSLELEIEKI